MDRARSAQDVAGVRRLLEQWNVHHPIARKLTANHYARRWPCANYGTGAPSLSNGLGEFFVARLELLRCSASPPPAEPVWTANPAPTTILDPTTLLRGDWELVRLSTSASSNAPSPTPIFQAAEIRFVLEGGELTCCPAPAAVNRGIAAVSIDGAGKGYIDLYSVDPLPAELSPLRRPGRGPSPRRDSC